MASMIYRRMTCSQTSNESGLMYIRYYGKNEDLDNGEKKMLGNRPTYSILNKQVENKLAGGNLYSLLVGREFKPDQYAIFLDFDNKAEGDTKHELNLAQELDSDQHDAPQQHTPSSGLHYIFYVDGKQAKRIGSKTCIKHNGMKYNIDVELKNGLSNCQPSKIPEYGEYKWEILSD